MVQSLSLNCLGSKAALHRSRLAFLHFTPGLWRSISLDVPTKSTDVVSYKKESNE
jgi:hypothetical protein